MVGLRKSTQCMLCAAPFDQPPATGSEGRHTDVPSQDSHTDSKYRHSAPVMVRARVSRLLFRLPLRRR